MITVHDYFPHCAINYEIIDFSFLQHPGPIERFKENEEFILRRIVLGPDYITTNRKIEIFIDSCIYLSVVDTQCITNYNVEGQLRFTRNNNVRLKSLGAVYLCGLYYRNIALSKF